MGSKDYMPTMEEFEKLFYDVASWISWNGDADVDKGVGELKTFTYKAIAHALKKFAEGKNISVLPIDKL